VTEPNDTAVRTAHGGTIAMAGFSSDGDVGAIESRDARLMHEHNHPTTLNSTIQRKATQRAPAIMNQQQRRTKPTRARGSSEQDLEQMVGVASQPAVTLLV